MTISPPRPTALRTAQFRAVHQRLDVPPVFVDPLAWRILGPDEATRLQSELTRHRHPLLASLRASVVARSRLTEDEWGVARDRGVRQRLILGAGLDTFAYGNPDPDGVSIIEADLVATQEWKRRLLDAAGLPIPKYLSFAPLDFERVGLAESLAQAGFDPSQPAFVSWLGVVMYLDETAVFETLRFVAGLAPGSALVFDYPVRPELLTGSERSAMERISARTAERGEPWKTFLDPDDLAARLAGLGFAHVEDFGAKGINARYFAGRDDGLRKSGVTRIVLARV
ncbi:MAG: class I SAM-dependent methyltransferase [Thermodesulfobacteriota bacterium]